MSRGLDSTTVSKLSSRYLSMFHLVTIELDTPIRLTDHYHDIEYNFTGSLETFTSNGRLVGLDSIKETQKLSNPTVSISLSGANSADISLALTESFSDKRVVVRRGLFDDSGETAMSNIIAEPFTIFDGRISSWGISNNPQEGESVVDWKVESHWADWERVAGRKTNNEDAQLYYPNEVGFEFTSQILGETAWYAEKRTVYVV